MGWCECGAPLHASAPPTTTTTTTTTNNNDHHTAAPHNAQEHYCLALGARDASGRLQAALGLAELSGGGSGDGEGGCGRERGEGVPCG